MGFSPAYCLDGAARKANLHKPVGLWPCHGQSGNQVRQRTNQQRFKEKGCCFSSLPIIFNIFLAFCFFSKISLHFRRGKIGKQLFSRFLYHAPFLKNQTFLVRVITCLLFQFAWHSYLVLQKIVSTFLPSSCQIFFSMVTNSSIYYRNDSNGMAV